MTETNNPLEITVPHKFIASLLRTYSNCFSSFTMGGSADVSGNRPENRIRELCQETGVKKELEDYFAKIVYEQIHGINK